MKVAMDSPWSQVFGFAALDHVPVGSCVLNSQLEVVFWYKVLERWSSKESIGSGSKIFV